MYKHVFIDLDDTIWDFRVNARKALSEIFSQLNLNKYFESFDHFFSVYLKKNHELWEQYGKGAITKDFLMLERFRAPLLLVGVDDVELSKKTGDSFLASLATQKTLMPYARELLEYLSAKYPLTIVSNGFIEVQHKKLRNSKIEHYFNHVVLSEQAGAPKPDKRIFEYALNLNNAKPEHTIMIGDYFEADIIGAKNAGIDQIFYNARERKIEASEKASFIIHSLNEIFNIL